MGAFDLGKYLADAGVKLDTEKEREQIEYINIDLIVPDPNNFYELSGLDDLASNIALCGLQQPLRVRRMPGDESQVIILSGHRRYAALKMLADEGRDDLRDVPCIVEYGEEKPELTQLKLIYANASTRVMTDAEKARQAEQVEKLLYALKESGMEFPGRMRDHVAEVCKISTGKIARLKVIKEKLAPNFLKLWEKGALKDDVAYELAHIPYYRQQFLFSSNVKNGVVHLGAPYVKRLAADMAKAEAGCAKLTCTERGKCDHGQTRSIRIADGGYCPGGCCKGCSYLSSCASSCIGASARKSTLKGIAREKRQKELAEKKEREAPDRALLRLAYQRVSQLRQERGVSAKSYLKTFCGYISDDAIEKQEAREAGGKVNLNSDRMPGGIWPWEARALCKAADLLGCSIDYLLGRTDAVNGASSGGDGWKTGTPEKPGLYITVVTLPGDALLSKRLEWDGEDWRIPRLPDTKLDSDRLVTWQNEQRRRSNQPNRQQVPRPKRLQPPSSQHRVL